MADFERAVQDYNSRRTGLAAHRRASYGRQNVAMAVLALGVSALAFALLRRGWVGAAVASLFIGAMVLGVVFTVIRFNAASPGEAARDEMRQTLFPALFPQIEGLILSPATRGFHDEIPTALKPAGDRASWGDLVTGTYRGLPIALNEVTISMASGRDTLVSFQGIALRTALADTVPPLIVAQESQPLERWISTILNADEAMPRIETGDVAFAALFGVHASDAPFARSVLLPEGRSRVMAMRETHARGRLQLAARGDTAWLLVEQDRDFLELPPLDQPFDADGDGRRLRSEMAGFLKLIDETRALLAPRGATRPA